MANVRVGNSHYVDSTGTLTSTRTLLVGALVTATAASAACTLQDAGAASSNKLDLRNATSGTTVQFRFADCPILFPNGVKASTLTNAVVTLIYTQTGADS